jgi:hypothetical protein
VETLTDQRIHPEYESYLLELEVTDKVRWGRKDCDRGCTRESETLCPQCERAKWKGCTKKVRWETALIAYQAVLWMVEDGIAEPWEMHFYPCHWGCGGWHVGHNKKKRQAMLQARISRKRRREQGR